MLLPLPSQQADIAWMQVRSVFASQAHQESTDIAAVRDTRNIPVGKGEPLSAGVPKGATEFKVRFIVLGRDWQCG